MSAGPALPALVALPELAFAEIDRRLSAAGWLLGAESQEPPLVAGEPHWCEFWRRDLDARVTYTFNPAVALRVLAFDGADGAEARSDVAAAIPHLDSGAVRALLDRDDERPRVLGLLAAAAMHDAAVLDRVQALAGDERPRVAAAAIHAREQIMPAPLAAALGTLARDKRAHPERSVLFAHLSVETKRQVLRWLVHDLEASNASIDQVLLSGLADRDPEVRITAVLAAARLGATGVARAVAGASLPETTAEGADPRERRLYARLRDAAVRYLGARAAGAAPTTPRREWPPLYQALSGPMPVADDMTLLVHALTAPVERGEPPAAPAGVVAHGGRWRIERSRLSLVAVGRVPHWIGHGGRAEPDPREAANPLRRATPPRAFFIAGAPLAEAPPPGPADREAPPLLVTRDEADRAVERLSAAAGLALRLPTADEWEMAMRGPDGRLYPWGNNLAATARGAASPWGAMLAATLEWTGDVDAEAPVLVGGESFELACRRGRARPGARAAVRVVLEAESTEQREAR